MPQFKLTEIQLEKDNTLPEYQEISFYDSATGMIGRERIRIPKDISCDYRVNINVHGYHSPDNLNKMWLAIEEAINKLNETDYNESGPVLPLGWNICEDMKKP